MILWALLITSHLSGAIQKNSKNKGVIELVAQIRDRFEKGHYNFMSWDGRSRLRNKLSEYENYAQEIDGTRPGAVTDAQRHRLKEMETELRALLGSTY